MTETPDPRMVLRDAIATKIHEATCNECPGDGEPRFSDEQLAEKVMELFPDVGVEQWLIGSTPVGEISLQIRQPDREPVSHTRFVLRTEPVPVRLGEARGTAA